MFVRPVPIVVATFVVGALSVSGALFLILEMDQPFAGMFQISTEPSHSHVVRSAPLAAYLSRRNILIGLRKDGDCS